MGLGAGFRRRVGRGRFGVFGVGRGVFDVSWSFRVFVFRWDGVGWRFSSGVFWGGFRVEVVSARELGEGKVSVRGRRVFAFFEFRFFVSVWFLVVC